MSCGPFPVNDVKWTLTAVRPSLVPVAAFLEFHAPYGGFIHPKLADVPGGKWNTLLQQGAVYNNFVRMDISQA